MSKSLLCILSEETEDFRNLCLKLDQLEGPIKPAEVKYFFDLVLNISAKMRMLEQLVYGKLKANLPDPMFENLPKDKRDTLLEQLTEMTQAHIPSSDNGKRTKKTHYDLLANLYEGIGYGRADQIIIEEVSNENKYFFELAMVDAVFRIAKQKVSVVLSIIQSVQYIEPMIITTMEKLLLKMVNPQTNELLFTEANLPQYIIEHKTKEYHANPILLKYYDGEKVPGYGRQITHVFNDAFRRIGELMFDGENLKTSEPHLASE